MCDFRAITREKSACMKCGFVSLYVYGSEKCEQRKTEENMTKKEPRKYNNMIEEMECCQQKQFETEEKNDFGISRKKTRL